MTEHFLYGLLWASFGVGHSLLVRPRAQAILQRLCGAGHRLVYSLLAFIHLAMVLVAGHVLLAGQESTALPVAVQGMMLTISAGGTVLTLLAVRQHGLGRFLGWQQVIDRYRGVESPDAPLQSDGLYRYCRHPAYLGTLMIFWGLALNPLGLATAVWASLYVLIGIHLEERDLVRKYGADYEAYRQRVPMLVPWRGSGE